MAGAGPSGSEQGPRDRDPPPSWDGSKPEASLRRYLKELDLWEAVTEIPKAKRAVKIYQALTGAAREAIESLTVDQLTAEDGAKQVRKLLVEAFSPYQETALPRAMETAIFGQPRGHREPLPDFMVRFAQAQSQLKDQGVDLPPKAQGYLLYKQANLSQELESRLLTWLGGDFSKDTVVANLRRLDRVMTESPKKGAAFFEGDHNDEEAEAEDYDIAEDEPVFEDFLAEAFGDSDLVEEEDLLEVLASYQDTREQIRQQKNGRGFFPLSQKGKDSRSKGKGRSTGSFGKGKGKNKFFERGSNLSVQEIKMRTKCRNCGQVGHWARECRNGPQQPAGSSSAPSASTPTSSTSRTSFFWASGNPPAENFFVESQDQPVPDAAASTAFIAAAPAKDDELLPVIGVTTSSTHGIVDTAAQEGLIGRSALLRLFEALRTHGLRGRWTGKTSEARGIGGKAATVGVVQVPVGLGGVPGVMELTVVADNVPLLIPVNLLRALKALVDLGGNYLHMPAVGASCSMQTLPSGHPAIDVTDYGAGWVLPKECPDKRIEHEFRLNGEAPDDGLQHPGPSVWLAAGGGRSDARTESFAGAGPRRSMARGSAPRSTRTAGHLRSAKAQRNWRVVLDKLCSLLSWARLQQVVGQWLPQGAPDPTPAISDAPSASTSSVKLAPTKKGQAYRNYLVQKKPEQLSRAKGVATVDPSVCQHPPEALKGGGNGHSNWFHCHLCRSRWNLSPRSASLFTGRALVENADPIPAQKTLAQAVTEQAAATKEMQHNIEVGDLLEQIVRQQRTIEEMQDRMDVSTGRCMDFERADEAIISIEATAGNMDPTLRNQTMAVIEEYRRIREMEAQTRSRANYFPTKETQTEWENVVSNLKTAAQQVIQFHAAILEQRAQVARAKSLAGTL